MAENKNSKSKDYIRPSHVGRKTIQMYKTVDEVAHELKFDLRVNSKQEVYKKAIELLYEQEKGKKIDIPKLKESE